MTHAITSDLVHDLVRAQHPDLADRPVRLGALGWGNQMWRLGDDLAVRLPWATGPVDEQLLHEWAWLPGLAPRLPLPIPVPQRLGSPSDRFPRPWMITTWVPGTPADQAPITRAAPAAESLAAFLTALHRPAPADVPAGHDRGGPLSERDEGFTRGVAAATERGLIDNPADFLAIWRDALAAPPWTGPPTWLHADLHPANVLTTDGTLSGVVDFGDMCAGDPAYDISAAWLLLPDDGAERFFAAYRPVVRDDWTERSFSPGRVGAAVGGDEGVGAVVRDDWTERSFSPGGVGDAVRNDWTERSFSPGGAGDAVRNDWTERSFSLGMEDGTAGGAAVDGATVLRARGWAMARVLSGLFIGDAGVHGRPGGKATWGPPARAALRRLTA
jgi:aminoglycoside phosphotransferase (APT) family kinase protein